MRMRGGESTQKVYGEYTYDTRAACIKVVRTVLTVEKLAQELKETPELKRNLIMRVARELLDSEAFMEAYPRIYETARNKTDANDELAKIITRLFKKNRVSVQDAETILHRATDLYKGE